MKARATGIAIRRMREEDRSGVMAILAHWNMAPTPPSADRPDPERTTIDVASTFVAQIGNTVVGVASYILHANGWAETASLAVDPAWRGAGIGKRLQDTRIAEMKARGVKMVRTETDRPEVIEWYIRIYGYRVVGRIRKKHAFGLQDVDCWTVLELDLGRLSNGAVGRQ